MSLGESIAEFGGIDDFSLIEEAVEDGRTALEDW